MGIENFEEDSELFDEKMTRLTTELAEMFAKAHKLEEEIKERLGRLDMGSKTLKLLCIGLRMAQQNRCAYAR